MALTKYERDLLDEGVGFVKDAYRDLRSGQWSEAQLRKYLEIALSYLGELQGKMQEQGTRRRRNPPLIVLSNPPVRMHRFIKGVEGHEVDVEGIISTEAHAILYRHFEDGKPYRHDFEHPTTLMAVDINGRKCVVIESPDGNPIWQDF